MNAAQRVSSCKKLEYMAATYTIIWIVFHCLPKDKYNRIHVNEMTTVENGYTWLDDSQRMISTVFQNIVT